MFNKNDPLIGSVKAVMQLNELRRQVEANLCEEIGIYSRQALPREYHANYDALLEQRMKESLHPNQQKLDVHEPEKDKLTAQDFKLLRAKKTMEEEDTKTSDPDMAAPTNPSQRGASNGQEIKASVPTNTPMPPPRPKNIKEEEIDEAAKSKAQQRLFGAALAARRGESEPGSRKVAKLAADVSSKELKKFAKTKHKGLPEKVDEDFDIDSIMEEIRRKLGEAKMKEIEEQQAGSTKDQLRAQIAGRAGEAVVQAAQRQAGENEASSMQGMSKPNPKPPSSQAEWEAAAARSRLGSSEQDWRNAKANQITNPRLQTNPAAAAAGSDAQRFRPAAAAAGSDAQRFRPAAAAAGSDAQRFRPAPAARPAAAPVAARAAAAPVKAPEQPSSKQMFQAAQDAESRGESGGGAAFFAADKQRQSERANMRESLETSIRKVLKG